MRASSRRIVVAIALFLAISPGAASAQKISQQFTRAYNAGQDAFKLGKYEVAKKHFERARDFEPTLPGPHRWLAAVALAQSRFDDCLTEARTAIELNPRSELTDEVRALHAQCREKLERQPFDGDFGDGGALAVTASIDGAAVRVNGLRYGATPMAPRALATGSVEVSVELPGYLSQQATVEIVAGLVTDVHFELPVDPDATEEEKLIDRPREDINVGWVRFDVGGVTSAAIFVNGSAVAPDERGRIEGPPGVQDVEIRAPGHDIWRRRVRFNRGQSRDVVAHLVRTDERRSQRVRGYVAVSVAAALAITGASFGILERRAHEEAQDIWDTETRRPATLPASATAGVEPVRTRADLEDVRDRGARYGLVSNIALGAAAVALGVGVYYFVAERPVAAPGQPPPIVLAPLLPADGAIVGSGAGIGAGITITRELDW